MTNNEYIKNMMKQLKNKDFEEFGLCDQLECHVFGSCRLCSIRAVTNGGVKNRKALYNELAELIGEPTLPKTHKITFEDGQTARISDESFEAMREKIG